MIRSFGKFKDYGECNTIRRVVKDIDKRFDVYYDADTNKYIITQYESYFDSVSPAELCKDFFDRLRKIVWINMYGSIVDEIDKNNAKIEAAEEKKVSDVAENFAKDIYKPLKKEILGV